MGCLKCKIIKACIKHPRPHLMTNVDHSTIYLLCILHFPYMQSLCVISNVSTFYVYMSQNTFCCQSFYRNTFNTATLFYYVKSIDVSAIHYARNLIKSAFYFVNLCQCTHFISTKAHVFRCGHVCIQVALH